MYKNNNVPTTIDLAIIAVPAKTVKTMMEDCVEVGVRGAIIISAGFTVSPLDGFINIYRIVRAIMPEDEPLIVDFHKRVAEESVYTRFFFRYEV